MSEQGRLELLERQLSRTHKLASVTLAVALIALLWVVLAFIVNGYQSNLINNLRQRIVILER